MGGDAAGPSAPLRARVLPLDAPLLQRCAVPAGHRTIVYNHIYGIKDTVYGEGTHFLVPFLEYAIPMDVRIRPRTLSSVTGTKGGWALLWNRVLRRASCTSSVRRVPS